MMRSTVTSRSKVKCESLPATLLGLITSNHMPVCNQTWLVDALCWPPQYSGVKGHASRSNVKVYLQDSIMVDNFPTISSIVTKLGW